jgi:hypothetical protein
MTGSIHFGSSVIALCRPRIEAARDAPGWYVLLGNHGWAHGDRSSALAEFHELDRIERRGSA